MAGHQGSHAEFISVPACIVSQRPQSLSHVESASLPYAGLTAWAAIRTVGGLSRHTAPGKRCLVLGGSGGVGTVAVQLLRAWNADVTATCSSDAMELVSKLGASRVADYSSADFEQELLQGPRFDFILDCVGLERPMTHMLRRGSFATYVTVNSPLLKNTDDLGLVPGLATSACQALQFTLRVSTTLGHLLLWQSPFPEYLISTRGCTSCKENAFGVSLIGVRCPCICIFLEDSGCIIRCNVLTALLCLGCLPSLVQVHEGANHGRRNIWHISSMLRISVRTERRCCIFITTKIPLCIRKTTCLLKYCLGSSTKHYQGA